MTGWPSGAGWLSGTGLPLGAMTGWLAPLVVAIAPHHLVMSSPPMYDALFNDKQAALELVAISPDELAKRGAAAAAAAGVEPRVRRVPGFGRHLSHVLRTLRPAARACACVLVGPPGSGKSSVLHVAAQLCGYRVVYLYEAGWSVRDMMAAGRSRVPTLFILRGGPPDRHCDPTAVAAHSSLPRMDSDRSQAGPDSGRTGPDSAGHAARSPSRDGSSRRESSPGRRESSPGRKGSLAMAERKSSLVMAERRGSLDPAAGGEGGGARGGEKESVEAVLQYVFRILRAERPCSATDLASVDASSKSLKGRSDSFRGPGPDAPATGTSLLRFAWCIDTDPAAASHSLAGRVPALVHRLLDRASVDWFPGWSSRLRDPACLTASLTLSG